MGDLTASAHLLGGRIDVFLSCRGPTRLPGVRILRRRKAYAVSADDGLVVLDLEDLFESVGTPWSWITRIRCLITNALAEGGLLQAELSLYFIAGTVEPKQARVLVFDPLADAMRTFLIPGVTRVVVTGDTTEIFASLGGPEFSAGTVQRTASHFQWTTTAVSLGADFDRVEVHSIDSVVRDRPPFFVTFTTTCGGEQLRAVDFEEVEDPDLGDWQQTIAIADEESSTRIPPEPPPGEDPPAATPPIATRGLAPETYYYYAAFLAVAGGFSSVASFTASTIATRNYHFSEKLYDLLPAVHRFEDERRPELAGNGQLRRFLQVFGAGLDQVRSLGEALISLKDINKTSLAYLPHLARWIGWEPDNTLPGGLQRSDIQFAPEIFATVGTGHNIRALVNRVTAWDCKVKEFVNNVFLTNAVEPNHLERIYESRRAPASLDFQTPVPQEELYPPASEAADALAQPDSYDGRPSAVLDGAGTPWLFWHSHQADGSGVLRRRVWVRRLDVPDSAVPVTAGLPESALFIDEDPVAINSGAEIQVFWASNRGRPPGDRGCDIWMRSFTGTPSSPGPAARLTHHPIDDKRPTAVYDAAGNLWVFWESRRRGPIDIWAMRSTDGGNTWEAPRRITSGSPRDRAPTAVLDPTGQLGVFYSADRGDHSVIAQTTFNGSTWSAPDDVASASVVGGPRVREESPAAIVWQGKLWLFWQSNRGGRFRVWAQVHDGTTWGNPFLVLACISSDKEPAAVVDGTNTLRLYLRSQRSAERFQSRTVDTSAGFSLTKGAMATPEDRLHYTYDARRTADGLYARGAVGLYLTPNDALPDAAHLAKIARARGFLSSFRPAPVRLVWIVKENAGAFRAVATEG